MGEEKGGGFSNVEQALREQIKGLTGKELRELRREPVSFAINNDRVKNEYNFIHRCFSWKALKIFGFEDALNCFIIEDEWTMAHVMHIAGIFPSVTSARKQGWQNPIPAGFSEHTVGKRRIQIFILNKFEECD